MRSKLKKYNITGMSCAACQTRIEKVVSGLQGVNSCTVNLLTNTMSVDSDISDDIIIKTVEKAGYGATLIGGSNRDKKSEQDSILEDKETPKLKKRLFASIIFLLILMYFSMGYKLLHAPQIIQQIYNKLFIYLYLFSMFLNFPLPSFFFGEYVAIGFMQMLCTILIIIINRKFFISGFKSLIHRSPNMDTLVALGSSVSFVWSVCVLGMMVYTEQQGGDVALWINELYFESSAMILTLITVGKTLEAYSKGKTTDALKSLIKLTPKTATIIEDGVEKIIDIDSIKVGDIFVVKPGENIPVDGKVIEGNTSIDESAITGESIPVDKTLGDNVSSATINQSGYIKCIAEKVGDNTTLSQIIKLVSDAQNTKAPIAKVADKVSSVFVPVVIIIAIITFIVWMFLGETIDFSLARAISVLVISCPCSLGLATPVAIMVGSGVGAKHGILFKNAVSLEETGKVNTVVFDKTGTITKGEPKVVKIFTNENIKEEELLKYAYSLEIKSEHPLAKAISNEAKSRNIKELDVTDFSILAGNGLIGKINNEIVIGGSLKYISQKINLNVDIVKKAEELANIGYTPLCFVRNNIFLGIIAVADTIKEDSKVAINDIKNMGINAVMLTGDNVQTSNAIAKEANIDNVIAGVLPKEKGYEIEKLKKVAKVAMIGDGINDAPALTMADVGIAIGSGTDVAIEAADIVLVNNKLSDVVAAIRLSKKTFKNIYENLFWAFFYNALCIPLAAGCFIGVFGFKLNPMIAALAMSLSSFCVVMNALRLNFCDIYSSKNDKKNKKEINNIMEGKNMTKIMKIEGMMCGHCEAHVKKALEAIDGVTEVIANHNEGVAKVTLSKDVDNEVLKKVVVEEGYNVIDVR